MSVQGETYWPNSKVNSMVIDSVLDLRIVDLKLTSGPSGPNYSLTMVMFAASNPLAVFENDGRIKVIFIGFLNVCYISM